MQFVLSPFYTLLGLEHGQCVAPTRIAMPHLAQVIFGKRAGKQNKNMNCFNCRKSGNFARDCTKSKVKYDQIHFYDIFVSSCLMLTRTVPF